MAAAGVPMRTLQEWMGHRNFATTLIYADYAPSAKEAELVELAFGSGHQSGHQTERNSHNLTEADTA
jgi:integrase